MAKQRTTRHSKSGRQPVTINLEAVRDEKSEPASAGEKPADRSADDKTATQPAGTQSAAEKNAPQKQTASPGKEPAEDRAKAQKQDAVSGSGSESAGKSPPGNARPEEPSRSSGSGLIPAILGGVIALAGAAGLQWLGLLPSPGSGTDTTVVSRIDDFSGRLLAIESTMAALPGEAARAAADAAREAAGETAAAPDALSGLQTRIDELAATIDAMRDAIAKGAAGDTAAVSQMADRVGGVEDRIESLAAAAPAQIAPLSERLDSLEQDIAAIAESADGNKASIDSLAQRLEEASGKIAELSSAIAGQAQQPAVARAIAAAALKSAIDRGTPFMAELETFAAVSAAQGGSAADIAALRDMAASGVPTLSDLQKRLSANADEIIAAANPPADESGVVDRLLSSARSLVKIRPVGEVEGESAAAVVARMEAALAAGDLQRALDESEALPEAPKTAASGIVAAIRARLTADSVIAETVSTALAPAGVGSQ